MHPIAHPVWDKASVLAFRGLPGDGAGLLRSISIGIAVRIGQSGVNRWIFHKHEHQPGPRPGTTLAEGFAGMVDVVFKFDLKGRRYLFFEKDCLGGFIALVRQQGKFPPACFQGRIAGIVKRKIIPLILAQVHRWQRQSGQRRSTGIFIGNDRLLLQLSDPGIRSVGGHTGGSPDSRFFLVRHQQ